MRPAVPGVTFPRYSSRADFFRSERFANFSVSVGSDVHQGDFPMTFLGPFVGRLSVVAAYVAIAFVGAIVLGVF